MRLEDRWLRKTDGWFQRLPALLQGTFIVFGLLGAVVALIPDLQIGLPVWLRIVLVSPLILMIVIEILPFIAIRWTRALSWPFRKAVALMRKAH